MNKKRHPVTELTAEQAFKAAMLLIDVRALLGPGDDGERQYYETPEFCLVHQWPAGFLTETPELLGMAVRGKHRGLMHYAGQDHWYLSECDDIDAALDGWRQALDAVPDMQAIHKQNRRVYAHFKGWRVVDGQGSKQIGHGIRLDDEYVPGDEPPPAAA